MSVNVKRTNKGMKYKKRDNPIVVGRIAKCGHPSLKGRYFKCETCQPVLPDEGDHPDLGYFQSEPELEDILEDNCE